MKLRFVILGALLVGGAAGASAVLLLGGSTEGSERWHWADSVPVKLDSIRVTKAGWRRFHTGPAASGRQKTWGWVVQLTNPTDETWKGRLRVEFSLYDGEGLFLAGSPTGEPVGFDPWPRLDAVSQQASGAPDLLDQVGQTVVELNASVSCPQTVTYDSLVMLIGEKAARERRQAQEDSPALEGMDFDPVDAYCVPTRTDEVTLRLTG